MFSGRRKKKKKGKKITRRMNSLYRSIKRKKNTERKEVRGIVRKEQRKREQFVKKNPKLLSIPQKARHRFKVQKEMGNLSKVKRPEIPISRLKQNETLYRNVKYGRDVETLEMKHMQEKKFDAITTLAETSWLHDKDHQAGFVELDEDDLVDKTEDLTQEQIIEELDLNSRKNVFDLELNGQSGFIVSYNKSGRHLLLGGIRGQLSSMEWRKFKPVFELSNISHRICDVCWMMDDSMLAVAGKEWQTRVYDCDGSEMHCVKKFINVTRLEYLPYHMLLVGGVMEKGDLHYLDISLGKVVSTVETSSFLCMTQNSYNAMILTGQRDGVVSMWTPRDEPKKAALSMKCHDGGITHIATSNREQNSQMMVTVGLDNQLKIWDIRKLYSCLNQKNLRYRPGPALALSDNDVLALSQANVVRTYKGIFRPSDEDEEEEGDEAYLRFTFPHGMVSSLDFCPYEDVLGIGWSGGVRSVIVPGSGLPEIDSRKPNPFFSNKHVRNWNVERVIDKIPWEMICLDPRLVGSSGAGQANSLRLRPDVQKQVSALDFEHVRDEETNELTDRFFQLRRDERREVIRKENEDELEGVKVKEWFEEEEKNPLMRFVGKRRRIELEKEKVKETKEKEALGEFEEDSEDEDLEDDEQEEEEEDITGKKRKRDEEDERDDDTEEDNQYKVVEKKRKLT